MRTLKILVAVMGVMLVLGVAVLAAIIAGRLKGTGSAAASFAAPAIDLPQGAHIEAMTAGSDRLIVDLALADGARQLIVIDLASGRKLGTIPLRPAP